MICVYLVNEEPVYIGMLSFSLEMLRRHNPNVDIIVYYMQDKKRDSRHIYLSETNRVLRFNQMPSDYESFSKHCEKLNVEIRIRNPKQNEAYYSLHRTILAEIEEETVFLLDADTFILGSIEDFPEIYSGYDFVATSNSWGRVCSIPGMDSMLKMFNSGVVLCQNGIFKKWMSSIEQYCTQLYDGDHYYSEFLWANSPECVGREEFSATLFVVDNNLKYAYFDDSHVQMGRYNGNACIVHTLSPNWYTLYNECFNKRSRPKLLGKIIKKHIYDKMPR